MLYVFYFYYLRVAPTNQLVVNRDEYNSNLNKIIKKSDFYYSYLKYESTYIEIYIIWKLKIYNTNF